MAERRATLWCQVLQKRVRVILVKKENSPDEIWIPKERGFLRLYHAEFLKDFSRLDDTD